MSSNSHFTHVQIIGIIIGACTLCELSIYLYSQWNERKKKKGITKTLMFPDSNPTCKAHYTNRHGCTAKYCSFSHEETSFYTLMKFLGSARRSLDLCVFVFTSAEMRDLVLNLHERGVNVRLITDKEQENASSSAVGTFREKGVHVRTNKDAYHMHHKFAIVDRRIIINGSFNWTRQAITGNYENLLITDNTEVVKPYLDYYEELWLRFAPKVDS